MKSLPLRNGQGGKSGTVVLLKREHAGERNQQHLRHVRVYHEKELSHTMEVALRIGFPSPPQLVDCWEGFSPVLLAFERLNSSQLLGPQRSPREHLNWK